MRRVLVIAGLSVLGAVLIVAAAAGPFMSRVETPAYTVVRSDGPIELRTYPPLTVATVWRVGGRGEAVNRGFRTLANYIFGGNVGAEKIEMTAPVLQSANEADASGVRDASGKTANGTSTWTIRFIMPRTWDKDRLPKPRDSDVALETVPAATFAVIRFSGFWRDALLAQKTEALRAWLARNHLAARGAPIYAFYNPPWTLPIFRRNEVMIEVAPG